MRPTLFTRAAADDLVDPEPRTVPRPRADSGVCLIEDRWRQTSAGGVPEGEPSSPTAPAPSLDDSEQDSGVYPIFETGDEALDWVRRRRAVQECTTLVESSPDDPALYLRRAKARIDLGTLKEALEDCSRALGIRPDYVDAYVTRASIQFDLEEYAGCVADCARAVRIDRTCVGAFQLRASARAAQADYPAAISDYDEAILVRSSDASLFRDRGEMKSRLGDLQGALDDLQVATAMNPADADADFKRRQVKLMLTERLDLRGATAKALAELAAKSDEAGRIV